jgi:PEGA domain
MLISISPARGHPVSAVSSPTSHPTSCPICDNLTYMITTCTNSPSSFRLLAALAAAMMLAAVVPTFAQQQGFVKLKVDPSKAGVFIDGKYVGPAGNFGMARKYAVAAGEHEVKLSEPRYEDMTTKVTVTAGKTAVVSEKLKALTLAKPPFGVLRTTGVTDKYDAVYINDKFYGHTGEFNNLVQGLKLPPGEYKLKVAGANGNTLKEETIKIEANKTLIVKVQ